MDLSALLAREGIQADDADALVAWARQRAAALVARIEPDSALAKLLGATFRPGEAVADVPVARHASRPVSRAVSRPQLGAAVQAALARNEPALERVLESAADESAADERIAAPEASAPAAVAEEEDASIGGFNRFAFSLRRRASETSRSAEDEGEQPTLTRGFEIHAEESSTSSAAWRALEPGLPAPPGFEARFGAGMRVGHPVDGETSAALVVGIPDDENIDVPVLRPRPRSESRGSAAASGSEAEPEAARSSEVLEFGSGMMDIDLLDLDVPEPPPREAARPASSPQRAAPPPPPPPGRSGPHPAPHVASEPRPAATAAKSSPRAAKTATGEHAQVKPAAKRGKSRKKVVELGKPVAPRKHSIGNHQPTGEPVVVETPAYLQDDDE